MADTPVAPVGTRVCLLDVRGRTIPGDPLEAAARLIGAGKLVAIRGVGGEHFTCRADDQGAVLRLRQHRVRDGIPLAVMVPTLACAEKLCRLTPADREALLSPSAPIVLLTPKRGVRIAPAVAPNCPHVGVMLPISPMYGLLFAAGLGPLAVTPANCHARPRGSDQQAALAELGEVADAVLTDAGGVNRHNANSIVFTFRDDIVPLRRARGFAATPIKLTLPSDAPAAIPTLALGGDLQNTVALLFNESVILSEHLGELSAPDAHLHFVRSIERLCALHRFDPQRVACDRDPRQLSAQYARRLNLPVVAVQHHHAHIAAVQADQRATQPIVGLACDGGGAGDDGAVWGCEILCCAGAACDRIGHLSYYPLSNGDAAPAETWRPAAAMLRRALGRDWTRRLRSEFPRGWERFSACGFDPCALGAIQSSWDRDAHTRRTSSLGRVFDGVAALLGVCAHNRRAAEAAVALEAAAAREPESVPPYRFDVHADAAGVIMDLDEMVRDMLAAATEGERTSRSAARFHETLARMLARAALLACESRNIDTVAVSGGCFANRRLLTRLVRLLEARDVRVLYPRQAPPGDGGLALGQCYVAALSAAEVPTPSSGARVG